MQLLPIPSSFILITNRSFHETEQLFTFHGGSHGEWSQPLGRMQGNINDPWFVAKLDYWRAKLMLAGVPYFQSVCAITNKQVKHLNDRERWERKASRLFNEYIKRVDSVRGDIFYIERMKQLAKEYRDAVQTIKIRYNQ